MLQVVVDGGFEFGDAVEDAAADTVGGNPAEEALDLVDPGARRGCEVHVEAAVLGQPGFDRRVLMGGIVVGDQVQIEGLGRAAVDGSQEPQPFLVAMALHALPDHPTGGDIERGEQRRRAVALVVVGHRSGPPLLHRQSRLRAIERLDLALLIDREHERAVRRGKVEADDILDLVDKLLVAGQLAEPAKPASAACSGPPPNRPDPPDPREIATCKTQLSSPETRIPTSVRESLCQCRYTSRTRPGAM